MATVKNKLWFNEAGLGIFIHWGPASVPAWAPDSGSFPEHVALKGWKSWFKNCSYADWYYNSMRIPSSPVNIHHQHNYGSDFKYDSFAELFKKGIKPFHFRQWAELAYDMGARYAVFVCKHHDGFLLWNSKHQNPNKKNYQVNTDVCGEVAEAFRSKGLKFGIYYSGGLDVTFNDIVIDDISKMYMAIPQSSIYADYVYAHYFELIDRYKPDILWNDIGLPVAASSGKIFRYFKEKVPHGVVNDRWKRYCIMGLPLYKLLRNRMIYNKFNLFAAQYQFSKPPSDFLKLRKMPYDFITAEYTPFSVKPSVKWELCRSQSNSFVYNSNREVNNDIKAEELYELYTEVVSMNGNLLFNIGPKADGSLPEYMEELLKQFGLMNNNFLKH